MKRKSMRKFHEHGGQARVLGIIIAQYVVQPVVALLVALGTMVAISLPAPAQMTSMSLGIGVSPTSMQTSNLPQAVVVHHDKNFVANLKANTPFIRMCARRELPAQSGNQHRLYMYQALTANTVQAAEGTVGSGITVSVVSNTSTIGQYSDYVNLSDLSMETAIDNSLENIQRELAFRLGLSLSTLVRNTADGAAAIDGSVSSLNKSAAVPFSKTDITSGVQSLAGRNVQAFANGCMTGAIHPFIIGDTINDATNNSLVDVLKRTADGQEKLSELPSPDGDEVPVLYWGGVRFHATSIVTQTANYLASGKTALRTYIVGQDGLICISLGSKSGTQIGEGDWRNLKLWMIKAGEPTQADPARMIGGWTAYNTKFVPALPPDTTQRIRTIDAVSNIS